MPEVIMPKMGDAMEEGTLLKWLKSEGDEVSEGDAIAEIETDKVTMELEAEDSGTLAELIASEGQDVPVGEAIAFIQGEGEEAPERSSGGERIRRSRSRRRRRGRGRRSPGDRHSDGRGRGRGRANQEEEAGGAAFEESNGRANGRADGNFRASPIVRRLADENDLDLSRIDGSGSGGTHRRARRAGGDGERLRAARWWRGGRAARAKRRGPGRGAAAAGGPAGLQAPSLPEPTEAPGTQLMEPTRMQRVIGERMTAAKQHVPHFYATVEVKMDAAMALRKQLNEQLEEDGVKLSVNDFVMKACAVALRNYPNLNALYTSKGIELHEKVDMAMAVALDAGLITPVIRDITGKGLATISQESKDLAKASAGRSAKAGRVSGRHDHGLQHGHVRGGELHRDHQPAAGRHSRRQQHQQAPGSYDENGRGRPRQLHEAHPLRRPPHR